MRELLRKHSAYVVFLISLSAGGLQFVGQSYLAHRLSSEDFSRISFILSQFSVYLLLVECGIQGELIRRLSSDNSFHLASSFVLRIVTATLGYFALLAQGLVTHVSTETLGGLAIFGLVLFPSAAFLGIEAFGFAQHNPFFSTALRVSRLAALVLYLTIITAFPEKSFTSLAIFPLVFVFALFPYFRRLPRTLYSYTGFRHSAAKTLTFVKEVWAFNAGTLLWWVFNALFSTIALKILGDRGMAPLTIGLTLTIPISLLAQAISNSWISHRAKEPSFRPSWVQLTFLALSISVFITLFSLTPVLQILFPKSDAANTRQFFIPFAVSQCLIAFVSYTQIQLFALGEKKIGSTLPFVSLIFLLFAANFATASTLGYWHTLCYFSCAIYLVARKMKRTRPAA